ncbi:MAG: CDGSH iron-sulfur domain-containing protein [Candidatus Omnitrophica bacterium]|nr:CDGSH iron-sulfur domain-containing protein [Candidatus Omnitrophota bacterium]
MAATITVLSNGPILVKGEVEVNDAQGKPLAMKDGAVYLCRCGASGTKPRCDGTHKSTGFNG